MEHKGQNFPRWNQTTLVEFILIGFSDLPKLQGFLFGIFLIIYLVILMGNSLIIIITKYDPSLQTPTYFFLRNFSFLEICYVSVTVPRLLADLCRQDRSISFVSCAVQMSIFLSLGTTECLILTAMAYDRYVAICNPLMYPVIMNNKVCIQLAAASWIIGIQANLGLIYKIFTLPFCKSNVLNHFLCDVPPVVQLCCGDISIIETWIYVLTTSNIVVPFGLILGSYGKIISTIMKLPSATGRAKAFSTCSSHLTVVILFFGSGVIVYMEPTSTHSSGMDKYLSLFYTILIPLFNPIIYCLRNKDVTVAMGKFLQKWTVP